MLPLKKFLRYADYGNGTVAVFETGQTEFIEFIYEGGTTSHGIDANQLVTQSDLEKWVANAKHMGIDTSAHEGVLAEWPVSP